MSKLRLPRPTYSGVVATAALLMAMGGTAYASGMINGSSIKNGTITAPKLKAHTLTGKQINLAKLGTVPNASKLGGKPPSSFLLTTGTAADSSELGGLLPSSFLSTSGTAADSAKLGGQLPSSFLSSSGTAADSAKLGGQSPSSFLSATGTAANSSKLGGLSPSQVLHGTSLTGSATFLALGSGPVLTIPGVGVVGATCSASGGGFDWTITTSGSDTYAVMPLTLGDGFFPVQSRYDDSDASDSYDPRLLDDNHTVTIHGGAGSGASGSFTDSEGVVQLVPVGGWAGSPVTLDLTGQGFNPQNTCVVRAFAQSWG